MYAINSRTAPNALPISPNVVSTAPDMSRISVLREADRDEVLTFLRLRPVHTVVMASFINDNGIDSPLNRGIFYGYRGTNEGLEGIALIGHTTLIEARSDEAMKAFATKARTEKVKIHLIMSEDKDSEAFWLYYAGAAEPRLTCTELLFETAFPMLVRDCDWDVREARLEEIEEIARAHAEVAFVESGIDPMERDRGGFLNRVARRIEMGRIYVVFDGNRLVFKADIIAETDETIYLEGIYVAPEFRGRGVGSSCLSRLSVMLLERAERICMLSNVRFENAHRSFKKAGFQISGRCTTLFV